MERAKRSGLLVALACTAFGFTGAKAREPPAAVHAGRVDNPTVLVCSGWMLDGYRIGMGRDEILAVRTATVLVAGQAQVIEPGRLSGVLVFDAANRLAKWDVLYLARSGESLRSEMRQRYGDPTSDIAADVLADETDTVRQRRTIWSSAECDVAIIVYENTGTRGTSGRTVNATLARASMLRPGFAEMKSLFR
jgi:hypothetical protein